MNNRQWVVKNSDLIESDKSKWIEIINTDFMSSEESDCEDGELFIKGMPWRARKVNKFFKALDDCIEEQKSRDKARKEFFQIEYRTEPFLPDHHGLLLKYTD